VTESPLQCVVDIGSSKILALAARKIGDDLRVQAYGAGPSRGVEKGQIVDAERAAGAVSYALERLEKDAGQRFTEIALTLGGSSLESAATQGFVPIYPEGRTVRRSDVFQAVEHCRHVTMPAGREQILAMPREYRVDDARGIASPVGLPAKRLEVITLLVTSPSSHVDAIQSIAEQLGRHLVDVVPTPLAAALGSLSPDQMETNGVLLDLGHGTTSIAVIRQGTVSFVAAIPVGAHHITRDIAHLLDCELAEAERVKCESGTADLLAINPEEAVMLRQKAGKQPRALKRRVLGEIISARLKETARMAAEKVVNGGFDLNELSTLYLTGGGALIGGADTVFGDAFGSKRVKMSWPRLAGTHARHLAVPEASAAVGAARYALAAGVEDLKPARGAANWRDGLKAFQTLFRRADRGF